MEILFLLNMALLIFVLIILLVNLFTKIVLKEYAYLGNKPLVSVLVPARNEENNIAECLNSLINQDYAQFEILVLSDNSTDNTSQIVSEYSKSQDKISLILGKELPEGWTGKNWACFQLAQRAKGEYLFFIDADVRLKPNALSSCFNNIKKYNLTFLSIFPTQKMETLGEYVVVPLMNWLLLSFLPLKLIYYSKNSKFSAANGQTICVKRDIYNQCCGHNKYKNIVVEDMAMVRSVKKAGYKAMTLLGGDLIYCRMYNDFKSSINGFTKNYFRGFNVSPATFIVINIIFFMMYLSPLFLFMGYKYFFISIILILINKILVSFLSGQNIFYNMVLFPIQHFILFILSIKSTFQTLKGGTSWKGRSI